MRRLGLSAFGLAASLLLALASPARAQDYPPGGRAITVIVPYAPGGGTDTSARQAMAILAQTLHATINVVNREGAASQVGLTELVRAKPDGLTLAYAVLPTVATHYLDPKRQAIYTRKSFQPIAMHWVSWMMLAVKADSPFRSLKDLVEAARAAPGAIKISDSGLLGTPHSAALALELAAGVRFSSVHFGGGAPSVTALLGGHVDVLAGGVSDGLPNLRAGNFRILGVASDVPDAAMPEIPTMRSQGYDVLMASIGGLVAPAGTPRPIVDRLSAEMKKIVESPEHRKQLADFGTAPYFHGPEEFDRLWQDNEARVTPLLAQLQNR